ncbi:RbsD/FucU family protein [Rhizobium sp. CECT 9324]|jgi:L-fucose mutarotase|uniref:RbsD/FucU family protein n=1 Tax=Rhizobium sp. CECT 9324 TaxID=2845820 RepID=UPI001E30E199|nr:RbsD/FucU family protein [Rhizobium sp. CECT 9324]CAH0339314.1 L-fucose mutarotase [Rhizobium sp. CECT 9324]
MLKGIDPLLSPELLATLRAMGHGDEIAIVDGNYPALEHGRRLVRLDGHHIVPVLNAVLSVMPIDDFVPEAIFRSTVGGKPEQIEPVHEEIIACCARHEAKIAVTPLVGADFYNRVKAAHTIVQTGEPRLYANVILRKGVIYP